jgi:hypothetical protein
MAHEQITYMTSERQTAWGIPSEKFTEYGLAYGDAQAALRKVLDKAERTHVMTVECQQAFAALEKIMRYFRDRFFKIPPLTDADWAALGFRAKDPHPTPAPAPTGVPAVSLSYPGGPHMLDAHLGPMAGTEALDSESDYGYAIYVGAMPPGGATLEQAASDKHYLMKAPVDGKSLQHYRFTRRRKERLTVDGAAAGMTVYVCARYENRKDEVGNWGPVVSAIIP